MLTTIDHIDVKVPNLEEFTAFFKSLGFIEVHRTDDAKKNVELALPGPNQPVFEVREADVKATVIDHVAFRVNKLEEDVAVLKANNATIDPGRERHMASAGRWLSNFRDPAGGKWQFTEDDLPNKG
jgi:catechol 2,3-dioxygenase-like lactoylglutathione lyase family enzyme